MFQFSGLASSAYEFSRRYTGMTLYELSHSEILGSKPASGSPKLIAGNHVLHRLSVPRHPPYALCNFTKNLHNTSLWMQSIFIPYYLSASLQCLINEETVNPIFFSKNWHPPPRSMHWATNTS